LRTQKRLRSGGLGNDGERRHRRPRGPRVYKCRREKSGCVAVFDTKEERTEHYAKVHNFVRTGGNAEKMLRCPLVNCDHRYPTKPKLEKHIQEAHAKFVEVGAASYLFPVRLGKLVGVLGGIAMPPKVDFRLDLSVWVTPRG
jgi:hypothetical protein